MLDISPFLMGTVFVLFLVSLALLNKWLYKPLITFMDNRTNSIKNDLENVDSNTQEVENLHKEADRIILEAKKEAAKIKDAALEEARLQADAKIASKKTELDSRFAEFITNLNEEKVNLKNSLLSQMPLFKESLKAKLSQL